MKMVFLSQCWFHKCTVKVDFHCRVIFYARIEVLETFGIRQTTNRSLQLRVCSFALPRFQVLARRSVQFIFIYPKYNTIQEYIEEL